MFDFIFSTIRFVKLGVRAYLRGYHYRWPAYPIIPQGFLGSSIRTDSVVDMFRLYLDAGVEPWSFQRSDNGEWSRIFLMPFCEEINAGIRLMDELAKREIEEVPMQAIHEYLQECSIRFDNNIDAMVRRQTMEKLK